MTVDMSGRAAVVTGAGGGLGREHSLALAARGAMVVVNDVAKDNAEAVVAEIVSSGGQAVADTNSVGTVDGGEAIVQSALDAFGRIDVVVNNAGFVRDRAFHNMSVEEIQSVLDVHLGGALYVTKAAWPHLREQNHGRVLFTTSAAGLLGNFGQANYAAAKAGVLGLMRVLAIEGSKRGITANAIAPVARTAMTEELMQGFIADRVPPRLVSPLVVWLSSEECTDSGNVYSVGGGRIARFALALTEGWTRTDGELTPEDVREHWSQINSTDDVSFPRELNDDFRALMRALKG